MAFEPSAHAAARPARVISSDADVNHLTIDGTKQRSTLIVLDRYHDASER